MSKFGDDLIQSLKETVDHSKREGPGIVHTPGSTHDPDPGDTRAEAADAAEVN